MKIDKQIVNDSTAIIFVYEEIEVYNAQELKDYIGDVINSGYINIIVDMKAVEYIDSSGLGVFVSTLKKIKTLNGKMTIASLKGSISQIFSLTSLDKVFTIVKDKEEALGQ